MPKPSLTDDLVAEILSFLPVEITHKFKSVSAKWHQIISHPNFTSLQQRRWSDRAIGFIHCHMQTRCKEIRLQPLPAFAASKRFLNFSSINLKLAQFRNFILSSSNGLFLIGPHRNFSVWNPTSTKPLVNVPLPYSRFERSKDSMLYGLAASPSAESFHIVGIYSPLFGSSTITIYSSKTRSWMKQVITEGHVYASRFLNPAGPAFVGGLLYWLQDRSFLTFDLETRKARVIELPRDDMKFKHVARTYYNVWFGGFAGYLYLVYVSIDEDVELWRLSRDDDDAEHWEKVMEADGCGWRAPLFFDGRRIAFTPVEDEWEKNKRRIDFFSTCRREWQGSANCYYDFFNLKRRFLPFYL